MKLRRQFRTVQIVAWGLTVLVPACSPTPVPGTAPEAIATIVVATQRAMPSPAASRTPAPSPTAAPTATVTPTLEPTPVRGTPESASRVFLRGGANSTIIAGHLEAGESRAYVFRGEQIQPVIAELSNSSGDIAFSVMSQGGTFLLRPGLQDFWRGSLPRTEDYYFSVYGGAAPQDFTLSIQFARRITFKEGAALASVGGSTIDGTVATYSVLGQKDERMVVTLSHAGQKAALGINGFVDGVQYLAPSEGETTYTLELPSTQDYILEVVPTSGETVDFVLDVEIR